MVSESLNVAVVGLGTIGTGVAKLLLNNETRNARFASRSIRLVYGVDLDLDRDRGVDFPEGALTDDLDAVLADSKVDVVVQLIGGTDVARSIMLKILAAGKDVVTANKALLAAHGAELFQTAREHNRTIAFEAAVAGGIPIIASISECLTANRIESVGGILNGTCNFIITQMQEHGSDYADVLAKAQELGYAEADPTLDVNGSDTAQKLAILSEIAFGVHVDWETIPRMGVDEISLTDIQLAEQLGYRIKLLATGRETSSGVHLVVSPTLIEISQPLASVSGAFNAVQVVGDAVGPLFYQGYGAGEMPTASAVVSDVIALAAGRSQISSNRMELWPDSRSRVAVNNDDERRSRWFVRVQQGSAELASKIKVETSAVVENEGGMAAISNAVSRGEMLTMLGDLANQATILPLL